MKIYSDELEVWQTFGIVRVSKNFKIFPQCVDFSINILKICEFLHEHQVARWRTCWELRQTQPNKDQWLILNFPIHLFEHPLCLISLVKLICHNFGTRCSLIDRSRVVSSTKLFVCVMSDEKLMKTTKFRDTFSRRVDSTSLMSRNSLSVVSALNRTTKTTPKFIMSSLPFRMKVINQTTLLRVSICTLSDVSEIYVNC